MSQLSSEYFKNRFAGNRTGFLERYQHLVILINLTFYISFLINYGVQTKCFVIVKSAIIEKFQEVYVKTQEIRYHLVA